MTKDQFIDKFFSLDFASQALLVFQAKIFPQRMIGAGDKPCYALKKDGIVVYVADDMQDSIGRLYDNKYLTENSLSPSTPKDNETDTTVRS